ASVSCGTEALIFGSFMMFASGVFASSPNSAKSSFTLCSSERNSGKTASILAANEISRLSSCMFAGEVKAFTMGKKEWVAKAGASSVLVYIILEDFVIEIVFENMMG